jgi:hypothetical protein
LSITALFMVGLLWLTSAAAGAGLTEEQRAGDCQTADGEHADDDLRVLDPACKRSGEVMPYWPLMISPASREEPGHAHLNLRPATMLA